MIDTYYNKKVLEKNLRDYLKKKHAKISTNSKNYWDNYIIYLVDNTIKNLDSWLTLDIPNEFKTSILKTIDKERDFMPNNGFVKNKIKKIEKKKPHPPDDHIIYIK